MEASDQEKHAPRAIVIGSSGGIGLALRIGLEAQGLQVFGLSRTGGYDDNKIDLISEASIAAAAEGLRGNRPFTHVLIATGLLHDDEISPEKAVSEVEQGKLTRQFAVNAVGPALIAKYFVPLLPRHGRSVFAALSARVGSISDNRLGGWYGYRASKAALNMFVRTLAIELGRTHPNTICVALHPGTVDTGLSKPFQKGIAANRLFSTEQSAMHLLRVIDRLTTEDSGRIFAWDGSEICP
jgi:NAD(P)-dependent dehydrogenase (short-subunit alcohol dehydrogenase family)